MPLGPTLLLPGQRSASTGSGGERGASLRAELGRNRRASPRDKAYGLRNSPPMLMVEPTASSETMQGHSSRKASIARSYTTGAIHRESIGNMERPGKATPGGSGGRLHGSGERGGPPSVSITSVTPGSRGAKGDRRGMGASRDMMKPLVAKPRRQGSLSNVPMVVDLRPQERHGHRDLGLTISRS